MSISINKKYTLLLVAFFLMLSNSSWGQSKGNLKNLTAPNDKALVYILRPSKVGFIMGMKIFVNEKPFGKTKGGKFLYGFFDPGTYVFLSKAENKKEIHLVLEAGKTYYLKQQVKMGIASARTGLERLRDAEGMKALKKCKLSKFQVEPYFK